MAGVERDNTRLLGSRTRSFGLDFLLQYMMRGLWDHTPIAVRFCGDGPSLTVVPNDQIANILIGTPHNLRFGKHCVATASSSPVVVNCDPQRLIAFERLPLPFQVDDACPTGLVK